MSDLANRGLVFGAACILSITPGPGILYTLALSLHGGKGDGASSAFGLFVGGLVHVVAAAIGRSSVLIALATVFTVITLGEVSVLPLGVH